MSEKELELKQKIQNSISRLNEFNAVLEQGQVVTGNDLQSYLQEAHWLQQNLSAWMYAEQHDLFKVHEPVVNPMEVQVSSLKAQLDELAQMAKAKTESIQEPKQVVVEEPESVVVEDAPVIQVPVQEESLEAPKKELEPEVEAPTEEIAPENMTPEIQEESKKEPVQEEVVETENIEAAVEEISTIEVTELTDEDKKELNDVISKDGFSLAKKLQASPLSDLKSAIGLNQRFAFSNELFGGNMEAFNKAVNELNHLESIEEAERMINLQLKSAYAWNAESELVNNFLELVNRRYL